MRLGAETKTPALSLPSMRGKYGKQLVDALVPDVFPNLTRLQLATGFAYSTINDWANGKADPRLEIVEQIVDLLAERGISADPLRLLAGHLGAQGEGDESDDAYPVRAPLLRALRESTDPFAREVMDELMATSFAGAERLTLLGWIEEAGDAARRVERRRRANPEPEAQDPRVAAHLAHQTRVREDAGIVKKDASAHPEKKRKRPPE
jgi:hypothetical protein